MSEPVSTMESPAIQRALGRSALYQLLALAFSYPDTECLERFDAYLADVAQHPIAADPGIEDALSGLFGSSVIDRTALEAEHIRLFAGAVLCSPHETEYEFDPFAKVRQLADISGFYQAFGLRLAPGRRTLPDFIATELEFMSLLTRKEAYASLRGWDEQREIAARAARSFLADHLGRWFETFCDDAGAQAGEGSFYAAAAALCRRFLQQEVAAAGVQPARLTARTIRLSDAEPASCWLDSPTPPSSP